MKSMRLRLLTSLLFTCIIIHIQAQVTIGVGAPPQKAAILDVKTQEPDRDNVTSQNGGLLLPRVQLQKLTSLMPFVEDTELATEGPKHIGLTVYNITPVPAENIIQGTYIWNDKMQWVIAANTASNGLTKSGSDIQLGGVLTGKTELTKGTDKVTIAADNAILKLDSNNKGFVPPRIALTGLKDNTTVSNPENGTIIYHTDNSIMPEGLHIWDAASASWKSVVMEIPETPETQANVRTMTVDYFYMPLANNSSDLGIVNPVQLPPVNGDYSAGHKAVVDDISVRGIAKIPFDEIKVPENGSYAFMVRLAGENYWWPTAGTQWAVQSVPVFFHLNRNGDFIDKQTIYCTFFGDKGSVGGTYVLVAPNCKKNDVITFYGGVWRNNRVTVRIYKDTPSPTSVVFWKL